MGCLADSNEFLNTPWVKQLDPPTSSFRIEGECGAGGACKWRCGLSVSFASRPRPKAVGGGSGAFTRRKFWESKRWGCGLGNFPEAKEFLSGIGSRGSGGKESLIIGSCNKVGAL